MAIDANVLICERVREELRNGSTPHAAIRAGYEKAWSTILDANVTHLIAALALTTMGTGAIKGFGVTLMIGILTSLFTSVTADPRVHRADPRPPQAQDPFGVRAGITMEIFNHNSNIHVPRHAQVQHRASRWLLMIASIGLIATQGLNYGLDFTGGVSMVVDYDQPVTDRPKCGRRWTRAASSDSRGAEPGRHARGVGPLPAQGRSMSDAGQGKVNLDQVAECRYRRAYRRRVRMPS